MSRYNYRIYIYFIDTGFEKVSVVSDKEQIENVVSKYDINCYEKVLIIKHDNVLDIDYVHDVKYISHKGLKRKR